MVQSRSIQCQLLTFFQFLLVLLEEREGEEEVMVEVKNSEMEGCATLDEMGFSRIFSREKGGDSNSQLFILYRETRRDILERIHSGRDPLKAMPLQRYVLLRG